MRAQESMSPSRTVKWRELAFFAILLGVLLLCTPVVTLFISDTQQFPLLSAAFVFFGIWLVLIIVAFILSNRLKD